MIVFQQFRTKTIVFQAGEDAASQPCCARAACRAQVRRLGRPLLWKTIIFVFVIIKKKTLLSISSLRV